jgi:hypothetical protein
VFFAFIYLLLRLWGKETRSGPRLKSLCPDARCRFGRSRPVIYEGDVGVKAWRSPLQRAECRVPPEVGRGDQSSIRGGSHGVVRPGGSIKWAAVG